VRGLYSISLLVARGLVVGLMSVATAAAAFAQGGSATATLSGKVTDGTGAVLPGVTVTLTNLTTNQSRVVVTSPDGIYRITGVPPSEYMLKAELEGFATFVLPKVTLNIGSAATVDATLSLSTIAENVTVTGESPVVEPARTDLSTVITKDQIETLPSNNRNYLDFTLLTPATVDNTSTTSQGVGLNVGGARAKEGSLLVDGFWNTDESFTFPRLKFSQDAIQEFQVVSLGGTAEFGRAIGGIVIAVTQSGSNQFHGSGYGFFRDEKFNAQSSLEKARGLPKSKFDRQLWGGSMGGPIVRDRSFFFGAFEITRQNTPFDNNIRAQDAAVLGLPPEDYGSINQFLRDEFAMGKASRTLNSNNTIQVTYAMTQDSSAPLTSAFSTRARQLRTSSLDQSAQFQWTKVAGAGKWLHDFRFDFHHRNYILDSPDLGGPPLVPDGQLRASNAPSVNITNVASFGGGRVSNEMFTRSFQAIYHVTLSKGSHAIKFGMDGLFLPRFDYINYTGPSSGTYNFSSLNAYLAGQYTTYTQSFGDPLLPGYHHFVSGFVQDSWAATNRLTVNYGLRYDTEFLFEHRGYSFGSDHNNFGPRLAASFDVTGHQRTFAKISSGVYYDRIFQNPIQPTYFGLKDDLQRFSTTWNFGQATAPVFPQAFPGIDLPANAPPNVRNVFIVPDEFAVPISYQVIGTLEHALRDDLALNVSILYNNSDAKELLFDRNLRFDDATQRWVRPDSGFRSISQYSFTGGAEYTGVVIELTKRLRGKLMYGGNITFAKARDQGDNFNSSPVDMRYPENEWGPQADTPTVRGVINAAYSITNQIQLSGVYRGSSGGAYDPRCGPTCDLNGDGQFNDRAPGFTRNSFRRDVTHTVDARLTWNLPLRQAQRLQFMLESFNLFNRSNVKTTNNTYGPTPGSPLPLFGTTTAYYPPREVQLGLRVVF
jgi:Carboxypeptidase regulatory-like domain